MTKPKKPRPVSRFTRLKQREEAKQPRQRKKTAKKKTWLVLLPRHTPTLEMMLADIGAPDADEIAVTFGVSRSTAYRWIKQGDAPRATMLALFYATQWGRSDVHARAHNDAVLQAHIARNLQERLDEAERKLARLGQIADFGAANDPAPSTPAGAPQTTVVGHAGQPLAPVGEPEKAARLTRAN